jgi:hypothetical protein
MGVPIRTATTMHSSDPVPVVEGILKKDPAADMYVLADSQHAYILQHFMKRTDRYKLDLRKRFKMRSFANGSPADVFLCKLHVLPAGPKK